MGKLKESLSRIIYRDRGCMCGLSEMCEMCDPRSAFNKLRKEIGELLIDNSKSNIIKEYIYGRTFKVKRSDIEVKL